jgi:hypothetical protein
MIDHPRARRRVGPAVEPLERRWQPTTPGVTPVAVPVMMTTLSTSDDPLTPVPPTSVGGSDDVPVGPH